MKEYKIEVTTSMMKSSDFLTSWNGDNPMPLKIMYGVKLKETKGMVMMRLHGDIKQRINRICMMCGRAIDNPISQFFGLGPKCGGHNYVNPFASEAELNEAIAQFRTKLVNTVWEGWVVKKWIESIDDDTDIYTKLAEMPIYQPESSASSGQGNSYARPNAPAIYVRVDKPAKGTDDYSAFVSFKYNPAIIDFIKSLPLHCWNSEAKEWEINYSDLPKLKSEFSGYAFNVSGEELIPDKISLSDNYVFKTKPMHHQIEGVEYGLDHNRWLLADDQGLGKTKQIIDLAIIRKQALGFKHCLIICGVNSLKWNWLEEIEKHSDETGWILGMKQTKRTGKWVIGSNADKLADLNKLGNDAELDSHYFIITNIESLRDEAIATRLNELCQQDIINLVAIDEIHRCRNLKTQQGQGMLQLQPTYRIGMTGTPLMNSPLDLFAILKWLGYQRYGYMSFKNHFCYTDEWGSVIGYKNIDQLEGQLDSIMLRRTKKQVLDLPDKVYMTEYVELTDEQKKLYNRVIESFIDDPTIDDIPSQECRLAMYLKLRQVSGGIGRYSSIKKNPKLDRLEQIVEEAVYAGTKVIVYSNWVEALKPAIERLKKYNPVVITGETKDSDRQAIVHTFQNDDNCKVIIGTIGAMGTGLTLTAATEVVFLDEPWNNATKEQACDRAHRIGTTSTVTIHTIIGYNTYDVNVHNIVLGKRDMSDAIVDKNAIAKMRIF